MAYSRGVRLNDSVSEKIIECATQLALSGGIGNLQVKAIITEMGISNRVFYNRFQNINEVITCIYKNVVEEMREAVNVEYDGTQDYYEFLIEIATSVLEKNYTNRLHFSEYMLEYDSMNADNRSWWLSRIKSILEYGMDNGLLRRMDADLLSYSVWCFCQGYNANSVGSFLSTEDVLRSFRLGYGSLIEGLKPKKDDN